MSEDVIHGLQRVRYIAPAVASAANAAIAEIERLRAENATIRKQAALIAAHNAELREMLVPESPADGT